MTRGCGLYCIGTSVILGLGAKNHNFIFIKSFLKLVCLTKTLLLLERCLTTATQPATKLPQKLQQQNTMHLSFVIKKSSVFYTVIHSFSRNTTEDWNYYFHMENQEEEIPSHSDLQRRKGLT